MASSRQLRPERRRGELPGDLTHHRELHASRAAAQPRKRGPLRPRLDVQGDGVGGARVEEVQAGVEFVDPGYCTVYGKRVNNFDTSRPFGTIDLTNALAYSVNSVFCNIGLKPGAANPGHGEALRLLRATSARDPADERLASGLYRNGKLFYPKVDANVDAGRMAFGQERMLVTPLQMAMVAGRSGSGTAHGAAGGRPHRRARRQGDRAGRPRLIRRAVARRPPMR